MEGGEDIIEIQKDAGNILGQDDPRTVAMRVSSHILYRCESPQKEGVVRAGGAGEFSLPKRGARAVIDGWLAGRQRWNRWLDRQRGRRRALLRAMYRM